MFESPKRHHFSDVKRDCSDELALAAADRPMASELEELARAAWPQVPGVARPVVGPV